MHMLNKKAAGNRCGGAPVIRASALPASKLSERSRPPSQGHLPFSPPALALGAPAAATSPVPSFSAGSTRRRSVRRAAGRDAHDGATSWPLWSCLAPFKQLSVAWWLDRGPSRSSGQRRVQFCCAAP